MSDPYTFTSTPARERATVDVGLHNHMQSIYSRMLLGLAITSTVAFITSHALNVMQFITDPTIFMVLALSPLAVVWFGFNPARMSSNQLRASFVLLSVLYGLSFSVIFYAYVPADIFRALLITTCMFAGLSLFGYTTKRDLQPVGVFCIMGVWGLLAYSVTSLIGWSFGIMQVNDTMSNIVAALGLVIFAGLTAWRTQEAKEQYNQNYGEEGNSRLAWASALSLYISFIAMFQYLLQLMGNRN